MPRGHPEALSDAWANLYEEFAVAINARRTGTDLPQGLLEYPTIWDGVLGVKFIQAAVQSHRLDAAWISCEVDGDAKRLATSCFMQ